jgi:chaperonin cofactor prefoldin
LIFQAGTLVNLVRDMKVNVDKIPGIDLRLSVVEVKVDRLENKVDRLENKFNRLHNKINSIGHK